MENFFFLALKRLQHHRLYSPWNPPGQDTRVGSCSLLQGIFPTQGFNPGLPNCRRILYQLSHQGSPNSSNRKFIEGVSELVRDHIKGYLILFVFKLFIVEYA